MSDCFFSREVLEAYKNDKEKAYVVDDAVQLAILPFMEPRKASELGAAYVANEKFRKILDQSEKTKSLLDSKTLHGILAYHNLMHTGIINEGDLAIDQTVAKARLVYSFILNMLTPDNQDAKEAKEQILYLFDKLGLGAPLTMEEVTSDPNIMTLKAIANSSAQRSHA